jgi:hypothetical protein
MQLTSSVELSSMIGTLLKDLKYCDLQSLDLHNITTSTLEKEIKQLRVNLKENKRYTIICKVVDSLVT